jgi:hypothetical protein
VRLLAVPLRHYEGDLISALAEYNARPRRLFAPLPQNGETPRYVLDVLELFEKYSSGRTPFEVRRAPVAERYLSQPKGAVRNGVISRSRSLMTMITGRESADESSTPDF